MKLLVICPTLSDSALAASFRLVHLLRHLLENGIQIKVYLSDPDISSYLKDFEKDGILKIEVIPFRHGLAHKIFYRVFGIPDSITFWGRLVKKSIIRKDISENFDGVFTSSPPHGLQVIGMELSKILRIRHFSDFRDDWMGSHRLSHLTPLHAWLSRRQEYLVLENSTLITHAIPFVAQDWKAKFPDFAAKIYSLSNGYSKDDLAYTENERTVKYPKKVIAYFGGGYKNFVTQKLSILRRELIESKLADRWMIVSGGPFNSPFKNDKVWIHYGNIPQNLVYNYMYNTTVHISLLPPGDLFPSRTIPLKLFTQVTTKGACVFIGNNGAASELFNDVDGVYFLGADGWDRLIPWIHQNENNLLSHDFKRTNIQRFNYDRIGNVLLSLIDKCKS